MLVCWKAGDPEALEGLVPLVYKELRDIARRCLRRELWYAKIPSGSHLTEMLALICSAFPR
jgi:hypothetical protein